MLKEYYIFGYGNYKGRSINIPYRLSECSWGTDEHDAFVKLMEKVEKNGKMDPFILKVSCRIRPTGRTKAYRAKALPFFESNDTPYIKGRITEFWVRFSMAETIEELDRYAERFKQYVIDYPFTENSLNNMRQKYINQKKLIESGQIKPMKFELKNDMPRGLNPLQKVDHYTKKAAEFLRARGFRVVKKDNNTYEITTTGWHEYLTEGKKQVATPLDLIFTWEKRDPELDEEYARQDLIPTKQPVLTYLGQNQHKEIKVHLKALKEAGLTPFVEQDDIGLVSIYVIEEEGQKAREVLKGMYPLLVDDYTDPYEFGGYRDGLGKEFWDSIDNMIEK